MARVVSLTIASLLVATAALVAAPDAIAAKGEVTHRVSGCDWFLVETTSGFALLEWYGGNDPDKGDDIRGSFESHGFKTVYNATADAELRVWVEDFWLSKDDALEQLLDRCE